MKTETWEVCVTYTFIINHTTSDCTSDDGPSEATIYDCLEKEFPDIDRDCWEWQESQRLTPLQEDEDI
jgi:hypothetical protein